MAACRRLAAQRGFTILEEHIYTDQAQRDRPGLAALLAAGHHRAFEIVLVDDLSRLARDNHLVLSVLAELQFAGVRVVSVAHGLDSHDQEATLGIQIRGIFNELQLQDLKKKTLRGQTGQKQRASPSETTPTAIRPCRSVPRGSTKKPAETRWLHV